MTNIIQAYREALGMYVCRRLSKSELDTVVLRALGSENIRKHNTLLLALLSDATRRALRVREGGGVRATWSKVLAQESEEDSADDSEDSSDDVAALRRRWRDAELEATAPIPHHDDQSGRRHQVVVGDARLDGARLVALKMDDISLDRGLRGVSASAVHLMTIALHAYARRAVRQCQTEIRDQRDLDSGDNNLPGRTDTRQPSQQGAKPNDDGHFSAAASTSVVQNNGKKQPTAAQRTPTTGFFPQQQSGGGGPNNDFLGVPGHGGLGPGGGGHPQQQPPHHQQQPHHQHHLALHGGAPDAVASYNAAPR
mmetsp:Transcript_3119/g.10305  ORF Transcript_3119/g.10305 Transcript_3119/m.10305 type:complete len:310 (-) Transcript_3119:91-1020(-)